jgi:hypothetical protein
MNWYSPWVAPIVLMIALAPSPGFSDSGSLATEDESAVESLVALLRPHVYQVTTPFIEYHWGEQKYLGARGQNHASQAPEDYATITSWAARYWNPKLTTAQNRDGFYLANDPTATRSYGGDGDGWSLTEITIPAGFIYLDAAETGPVQLYDGGGYGNVDPGWTTFQDRLKSIIQNMGCDPDVGDLLVVHQPTPRCQIMTDEVVRRLGISAIYYTYSSSHYSGCNDNHDGAFLLTRTDWLKPDAIRVVTKSTNDLGSSQGLLEAIYERGISDQSSFLKQITQNEYSRYLAHLDQFPLTQQVIENMRSEVCDSNGCHFSLGTSSSDSTPGSATEFAKAYYINSYLNQDGTSDFGPLWPDESSKLRNDSTDSWLHSHIFQCGEFSKQLEGSK